jgi:hypothetical protein
MVMAWLIDHLLLGMASLYPSINTENSHLDDETLDFSIDYNKPVGLRSDGWQTSY